MSRECAGYAELRSIMEEMRAKEMSLKAIAD
jgi:hypothetical protein